MLCRNFEPIPIKIGFFNKFSKITKMSFESFLNKKIVIVIGPLTEILPPKKSKIEYHMYIYCYLHQEV